MLRKQVSQQIMRQGVPRIARQGVSQHLLGFPIAILNQQRPRFAEAAEAGIAAGRCRAAKAADRLIAMT